MENCDCYSLSQFLEHKDYMTESNCVKSLVVVYWD